MGIEFYYHDRMIPGWEVAQVALLLLIVLGGATLAVGEWLYRWWISPESRSRSK